MMFNTECPTKATLGEPCGLHRLYVHAICYSTWNAEPQVGVIAWSLMGDRLLLPDHSWGAGCYSLMTQRADCYCLMTQGGEAATA